MSLNVIKTLATSGRYKAFKDTCCNLDMIKDRLAVSYGTPFGILQANTALMVDALKAGGAGLMGPIANVAPEYVVELYNKYSYSDLNGLPAVLNTLQALIDLNYIPAMKYILSYRGLPINYSTRYGTALTEEQKQLIENGLESLKRILPDL